MNELLQQLSQCITTSKDSNGEPCQVVDIHTAIPLIIEILEKMNNA